MTTPNEIPDEWDFYQCRVDDAPASIFLNFWYASNSAPAAADTLYWAFIHMITPGPHGMGDDGEADRTFPLLDQLTESAEASGLYCVARVRNHASWQIVFYGNPGKGNVLSSLCQQLEEDHSRETEAGEKQDPGWSYYHDFLMPDQERRQWMQDRRVVEALAEHGDPLTKPRRVDHWAYFPISEQRDAYVSAAAAEGFAVQDVRNDVEHGAMAYGAQLHRVDPVRLADIHDVVMLLHQLAASRGGEYDGWETSVEKEQD